MRAFKVGNVATIAAGMGFYAYLLTNILWLTYVWGYSVLRAGLALVPAALIAAVVAAVLGPIAAERGYRLFIIPGALVWASGYVWYATQVGTTPAFLTQWLPGQVLSGIGVGMTLPLLGSATLAAVPGWPLRDRLRRRLEHPADGRCPGHRPARGDHRDADAGDVRRLLPGRLVDVGRLLRGGRGHRSLPRADRAGHRGARRPVGGTHRGAPAARPSPPR